MLGSGNISAGSGVAWSATDICGIVGQGVGKTTIVATAQAGPVLDFRLTQYVFDGVEIGGFTIQGDGVATAANKGIAFSSVISNSKMYVHDIFVQSTGGPCYDFGILELSVLDRLYAKEPVNAGSADVAYVVASGPFNGNTITGLQLYGVSAGANVGVSGAVIVKDNGVFAPHDNHWSTPKCENLHVPTNGTMFAFAGNAQVISNPEIFDSTKVVAATGTSHIRFTAPAVTDQGGNLVTGVIPGKSTGATDIDMGIDMQQSRNAVIGVKGFKGTNVILAAGVGSCGITLYGSLSGATDPAVVDNSGVTTNYIFDAVGNLTARGAVTLQQGAAKTTMDIPGGALVGGIRLSDPVTPANGQIGLGTSGVRAQASGVNLFIQGDEIHLRNIALNPTPLVFGTSLTANTSIRTGTGSPETVVTASVGSLFLRTDGGAGTTLYVKESGAGNTGWIAK